MERGPNDLEERIEMLEKQKRFMQDKLRQAGDRIKDLEEINTIKFGFLNDPDHHIYLPEEITISSDEHRKKLKLKSSTLKEKKTVNFPVDFKPGKKLIIKIK